MTDSPMTSNTFALSHRDTKRSQETFFSRLDTGLDIVGFGVVVVLAITLLTIVCVSDRSIWVDLVTDDAYYYLGIARNIVEHGSSQFLPPFTTNGYQPLWVGLLAVTGILFGTGDKALMLECLGLTIVGCGVFVATARKLHGAGLPAVLTIVFFAPVCLSGMETALLPAVALLYLAARGWKKRGVLGALLFLVRLDALALVLARDLYVAIVRRKIDIRPYAIIAPVIAVYLIVNMVLFGLPLPVSGLIKSVNSTLFENIRPAFSYVLALKSMVFVAGLILIARVLVRSSFAAHALRLAFADELVICSIALVICFVYYGANSGWPLWPWYYWPSLLLSYYTLQEARATALSAWAAKRHVLAVGLYVAGIGGFAYVGNPDYVRNVADQVVDIVKARPLETSFGRKNIELVNWVAEKQLPAGTFFGMGDRAGSFGFFLGGRYRFLHAEGLVASKAYYEAIKNDSALAFIDSLNVDYWIADREHFFDDGETIGVIEPIQALSMRKGPFVLCFSHSAVALDQSYPIAQSADYEFRYVLAMNGRVACPEPIQAEFRSLRDDYTGIRNFSMPIELKSRRTNSLARYLRFPFH